MIEQTLNYGVLTLSLAHGKANALDLEFLHAISRALEEAKDNTEVRVVVLTGSGSIFSAGVDLKRILDGGREYANRYIPVLDEVLEQLFVFPRPVVAAVNGHAIAGGCILALACDYKIMATGKGRMGVPELKVGVPFPASAFEIVKFSAPRSEVQALYYRAETLLPEEVKACGLVDELAEPDDLMTRAVEVAAEFAAIPGESFELTKRMLRSPAVSSMEHNREVYGRSVLDRWSHDETYAHIRGYLEKTLRK